MAKKKPAKVKIVRTARTKSHALLEKLVEHTVEYRKQQAQTETHLSKINELLVRLTSAGPHGYAELIQAFDRNQALLSGYRESLRTIESDIEKLQKFVGAQSAELTRLARPVSVGPTDGVPSSIARGAG